MVRGAGDSLVELESIYTSAKIQGGLTTATSGISFVQGVVGRSTERVYLLFDSDVELGKFFLFGLGEELMVILR